MTVRPATPTAPARPARGVSFEFFPPKGPQGAERLTATLRALAPLDPDYASITCGAGGTAATGTVETVDLVQDQFGLAASAHVTCAGATRDELWPLIETYRTKGVRRIVALRGDGTPQEGGFTSAAELVAALRRFDDLCIAVGAYPETHPKAESLSADLDNLKRKQDAGADYAITQYCFDTERLLRFRDTAVAAGITLPIVVGLMPVHNFPQIRKFSLMCGAVIPDWLAAMFADIEPDSELARTLAGSLLVDQARRCQAEGFAGLHVYTLNRAELTLALMRVLDTQPLDAVA